MILFRLVGGRFDGADGEGKWKSVPNVLWARHDPDSPGRFKGRVTVRQRPLSTAYDLSGVRGDVHIYVCSDVTDAGYGELADQSLLPVAA